MRESFATTRWTIDDVLRLRPNMTRLEASRLLMEIEDNLEESMVKAGWNVINRSLKVRGLNKR